jgi:hypothetical protein
VGFALLIDLRVKHLVLKIGNRSVASRRLQLGALRVKLGHLIGAEPERRSDLVDQGGELPDLVDADRIDGGLRDVRAAATTLPLTSLTLILLSLIVVRVRPA